MVGGLFCESDVTFFKQLNIVHWASAQQVTKHALLFEKAVSGKGSTWLTSELKSHIREHDFYQQEVKRTVAEIDWSTYRRMRNKVSIIIRKAT